jgi:hypothetical protein
MLDQRVREQLPPSSDYQARGKEAAFCVGGGEGNVIGAYTAGGNSAAHCVIDMPDHFGWRVPQMRAVCDELAARLNAWVVCPDVHRGNSVDRWVAQAVRRRA